MTDKIYFGVESINPLDGLSAAASVIEMLNHFVAVSSDLALFERNDTNRSMDGLNVVLDSATRAITTASADLWEKISAAEEVGHQQELDDGVAIPTRRERIRDILTGGQTGIAAAAEDTGGDTYPKIGARDAAIRATFAEGYDLKKIAQAVNMKDSAVAGVLRRLADIGELNTDAAERLDKELSA